MKSLIILSILLTAGLLPYVHAQEKPENTGGHTGKTIDVLFPTLQKDISDMNARSGITTPDRTVISTPTKKRLFTNYQPAAARPNAAPTVQKKAAALPSAASSRESADREKQTNPVQPAKVIIPSQGDARETTTPTRVTPVKKH
ncbi:hypothetical protein HGH93_22665 [Chitinophaga polysaccharea]|uniref:hypothetical protein n=1 Tax=Chitinophaga TaxID=79328 RepID=UPI001455B36D|nr:MULTISPECIES: hypothetical protein [Chitinophaga]NLR60924.1 hypothetical protein [Chitinophaga polysaccharea]NLU94702.1 hypothetical protein [Chitinophaga sp. Ak27]